jgi:hypothetical protein
MQNCKKQILFIKPVIMGIETEMKSELKQGVGVEMKREVYEKILTNSRLQAELMLAFDKSFTTVRRWAKERNEILTSIKALKVIAKYTDI